MKSRFLIFTSLVLAVLCLGSASNAMAQSVTGGGVVAFGTQAPLVVTLSARIGANGPTGNMALGLQSERVTANVVDLCILPGPVPTAYVTAQITKSNLLGLIVGEYLVMLVIDFGNDVQNNPDVVVLGGLQVQSFCGDVFNLIGGFPITGNFTVNP